jgi:hypothetical protein
MINEVVKRGWDLAPIEFVDQRMWRIAAAPEGAAGDRACRSEGRELDDVVAKLLLQVLDRTAIKKGVIDAGK